VTLHDCDRSFVPPQEWQREGSIITERVRCPGRLPLRSRKYRDQFGLARCLFAPAATPKPVLEALFRAITKAMQLSETIEKLNKQNFNIVPNKSLADAKTWLADEMKHWENITSAVKIDIAR